MKANQKQGAGLPALMALLREARATLEMWKDVAPAVSLCADIDKALADLRAQADARPVTWNSVQDMQPSSDGALLVTNNLAACEASNGANNMWLVGSLFESGDSYEAFSDLGRRIENISHWRYALEHPAKASAPGLSDAERLAVRDLIHKWQADYGIPVFSGTAFCALRDAILTRASAATVAEPRTFMEKWSAAIKSLPMSDQQAAQQQAEPESVIKRQAQKIAELIADRDSWIEAHARLYRLYHDQSPKAGEEIHVNVEGGDVYTLPLQLSGMDKPRFVVHVPCSPQAEPGADERAAFEAWIKAPFGEHADLMERLVLRRKDGVYESRSTETAWDAWQARAAQSGQRAGVAPLERIRELATEGMCHGLLADDKCREILEALDGNVMNAANTSSQKQRIVIYVCPVCNATLERKE